MIYIAITNELPRFGQAAEFIFDERMNYAVTVSLSGLLMANNGTINNTP